MTATSEAMLDDPATFVDAVAPDATAERPAIVRGDRTATRAFLSVVDQAVVSGTNFVTTVVIGRLCTKHELGVYSLAFSIVLLARGIQYQVVSAPYMIYWSRRPLSGRSAYLGSSLLHQLVLTLLVGLGLAGYVAVLWRGAGPPGLLPVVCILLCSVPFLLMREFIRNLALSQLRMIDAIVIDAAVALLQLGLILVLGLLGLLTIPAVYAVMGLACLAACLYWRVGRTQSTEFVRASAWDDWRQNWSFGKWALSSHLVGGSIPYIMPWIVAVAHGEAETGVLAAATTLVGLSNTFVMGLGNFLTPRAALAYTDGGVRALIRVLASFALLFSLSLGAFCLAVALFGDPLAVLLYGDRYRGIGLIITLLACTVLANSLRMTAGGGLWSIERPRANFGAEVCTMVVTIGVSVALVGPFGVLGAAIGMLCGAVAGAVTGAAILIRSLGQLTPIPTIAEGSRA